MFKRLLRRRLGTSSVQRDATFSLPGRQRLPTASNGPGEGLGSLYTPLEEGWFRLLYIQPASNSEAEIECKLCPYLVNKAPPYSALSYTWGEPIDLRWITINAHRVQIRPNLEAALRRFRRDGESVCMWVDALCINQDSIPERNQQVAMMARFYSQAEETTVWLGETSAADFGGLVFFHLLRAIVEQAPIFSGEAVPFSYLAHPDWMRSTAAMIHLCNERPYWMRVWVIQEIARGKKVTVHCGLESVDWDIIEKCTVSALQQSEFSNLDPGEHNLTPENLLWINSLRLSLRGALWPLVRIRLVLRTLGDEEWSYHVDLPVLLRTAAYSEATDPRDKVFALLGVAHSSHGLNIDYGKSLAEVCTDATRAFIQKSGSLRELSWLTGNQEPSSQDGFPSWVRDLRLPMPASIWAEEIPTYPKLYNASGSHAMSHANISFQSAGRTLCVNGIFIDKMCLVGDSAPYIDGIVDVLFEDTHSVQHLVSQWKEAAISPKIGDAEVARGLESFWRTILIDQIVPNYRSQEPFRGRLPQVLSSEWHIPPSQSQEHTLLVALAKSNAQLFGRRFFLTSTGIMGLGPRTVRVGDEVFVLFGADVPFLLRKREEGPGFTVVGEW
jgi:hypothetical protein